MLQENLLKIYETSFRENREMSALTDYFKGETFSYYEMAKEIAKIHLLFKKAGIKQGDKIALIGRNNPRWCITYMGTITYGAVIVPILQDFTPADIIHIINHSESRLLFLGDNFWDVIEEDQIKQIEAVFSLTDFHAIYERDGKSLTKFQRDIVKNYRTKYPRGFSVNDIKYAEIPNDQVVLLNYTSGTTGYSKGVMLTVNNLTSNVMFAATTINTQTGQRYFQKGGRTLSFLPLAHAYGCAFDFLSPLAVGGHITLLGKIPAAKILLEAMAVVKPTVICCVPMILEKVYRKQVLPMLEKGPMSIAMKIPLLNSAIYSVIRKKLMDAFGGNVDIFIVGGAPMNQETESFLMKIKFPITIGYGMTECAPLISFTPDNEFKAGSCGRFLKGLLEVRIDSEDPQRVAGEILVRGEHVMKGYYKNDKDTHKVLDEEGWLHTGDMATMDPDGTLYIRGRSKTMILSGNGQNIYPEEIEDKLNNMYLVLESLVLDAGNGKIKALVVPDYEQAEAEGVDKADLPQIMQNNLQELNAQLAAYERQAAALRKNIDRHFGGMVEGFDTYRYYTGNDRLRAWICIPLTVGIDERKEATVEALFSPKLWTENGLLTRSGDKTFWDRSTLYALRGVYASGETEKATGYLSYYSGVRLLGDHVPYAIEAWPEGSQRHLSAESGLYCRILTEGVFGIRPTGFRSFTLTPRLPAAWDRMNLRNVRAFGSAFDIEVRRAAKGMEVAVTQDGREVVRKRLRAGQSLGVTLE